MTTSDTTLIVNIFDLPYALKRQIKDIVFVDYTGVPRKDSRPCLEEMLKHFDIAFLKTGCTYVIGDGVALTLDFPENIDKYRSLPFLYNRDYKKEGTKWGFPEL